MSHSFTLISKAFREKENQVPFNSHSKAMDVISPIIVPMIAEQLGETRSIPNRASKVSAATEQSPITKGVVQLARQ